MAVRNKVMKNIVQYLSNNMLGSSTIVVPSWGCQDSVCEVDRLATVTPCSLVILLTASFSNRLPPFSGCREDAGDGLLHNTTHHIMPVAVTCRRTITCDHIKIEHQLSDNYLYSFHSRTRSQPGSSNCVPILAISGFRLLSRWGYCSGLQRNA